ncbi:hypothetical protein LK464_03530 [Mycobacteroides abscessus subsp. abscessus]|uniref:hypothetical protein n=1 Tax=Mycobacteroides abscessus TaxID=36809 RepID=UPI0018965C01|nr:hypothetical protein [Mycobacteroides abscessus]UEA25138.1 hypothetical protein LK464_03530 [Mycobacteroides abscessus subsp. abscessus]
MNEHEIDDIVARFRHTVETEVRDAGRPAHLVAYAGAVAAALSRGRLTGGGPVTEMLMVHLAVDRRAEVAGNELGVIGCLSFVSWVAREWHELVARAGETEVPTPLTPIEEQHRLAAIATAADRPDLTAGTPRTAVVTLVGVLAAARARWDFSGLDGVATASQQVVIRDVLETDPVAEAAAGDLGEGWQEIAAPIMIELWDSIHARATETATLAAIETAA